MELIENKQYQELLMRMCKGFPFWAEMNGKGLLISGVSGMLGSLLVDTVMLHNRDLKVEDRCRIIGIGRNQAAAEKRFKYWMNCDEFLFLSHDISTPLPYIDQKINFFIHAASPADPVAYVAEPVNTICANVLGTQNILQQVAQQHSGRFLLCSSVEIYGENRGEKERFEEDDCGYLNCNALRGGYPEAKRVSEALCQAYIAEKNVDVVIIRLPRCYGPTMRMTDSKALAQFIKKALAQEDVVLKSTGNQFYSFLYAVDAVLAILWVLLRGKTGEAYNAGDSQSDITLTELANMIAKRAGTKVRFEIPEEMERKGYSVATKALLDAGKLKKLGWAPRYTIETGTYETIQILKEL